MPYSCAQHIKALYLQLQLLLMAAYAGFAAAIYFIMQIFKAANEEIERQWALAIFICIILTAGVDINSLSYDQRRHIFGQISIMAPMHIIFTVRIGLWYSYFVGTGAYNYQIFCIMLVVILGLSALVRVVILFIGLAIIFTMICALVVTFIQKLRGRAHII